MIGRDGQHHRRGPVRRRRDHRRRARPQPHDGQLPARLHRVRPPRRPAAARRAERTPAIDTTRPAADRRGRRRAPLRVVAEGHPQDLRDALETRWRPRRTRSASASWRRSTPTSRSPTSTSNLVCQDTGTVVFWLEVGEDCALNLARITAAVRAGTARATLEHSLRPNAVHPVTRQNTRRTPAAICPSCTTSSCPDWDGAATPQAPLPAQGLGLREHELPEDADPGRRREGRQALHPGVRRRGRPQALPADDRRRRAGRLRPTSAPRWPRRPCCARSAATATTP